MFELYLSSLILYCILALGFGALIGYKTLTQTDKNLEIFGAFKKFKLITVFEWIYSTFAKLIKVLTGIDIDPEIKK